MMLCVLAAVAYGIVHDQISVRISPAYLLDWHPTLIESRDPTLVALVWGVVATWWFGFILGAVLALAATLGKRPSAAWSSIVRAIGGVFLFASFAATVASLAFRGLEIELPDALFGQWYAAMPRREDRIAFSQVAAMHEASYDGAGVATVVAAFLLWRVRGRSYPKEERGTD